MTYKEKSRRANVKKRRRARLLRSITRFFFTLVVFLSMITLFLGLGGADGNTKVTIPMILIGLGGLILGILVGDQLEEYWKEWEE